MFIIDCRDGGKKSGRGFVFSGSRFHRIGAIILNLRRLHGIFARHRCCRSVGCYRRTHFSAAGAARGVMGVKLILVPLHTWGWRDRWQDEAEFFLSNSEPSRGLILSQQTILVPTTN